MPTDIVLNNRYRLDERQGSGGMAMVYRAHDLMLERTVAIKILRKDFSSDPHFRERFRQEARAAANLSHPNIVTVHDFGLDEDRLFIVMEFVQGAHLKAILGQRGRLGLKEALDLGIQACAGIGSAHQAGVVHCDVKAHNMLVTPDLRLKVVDFGIARALASIRPDEQYEVVWGSPQYFSPEQAAGMPPSPASDVYSLGVVIFEMLTGQLPFNAPEAEELARMHRETPAPSPRKLNPAIPPELEQALLKCLSKDPANRYRSANQLGSVLATLAARQFGPGYANLPGYPADAGRPLEGARPAPAGIRRPSVTQTLPQPEPLARSYSAPVQAPPPVIARVEPDPRKRRPAGAGSQAVRVPTSAVRPPAAQPRSDQIDWLTWLLGLLALIAVGGLIPFWLWVYYIVNPPL